MSTTPRYALATHYHMDHAGLAEELKLAGVPLLVLDVQSSAIPLMREVMKPHDRFVEIVLHGNVTISFDQSRRTLARIGLAAPSGARSGPRASRAWPRVRFTLNADRKPLPFSNSDRWR